MAAKVDRGQGAFSGKGADEPLADSQEGGGGRGVDGYRGQSCGEF